MFFSINRDDSQIVNRRFSLQVFNELPTLVQDIFSRPQKKKSIRTNKEMTTLSTIVIETPEPNTVPSVTRNNTTEEHDVCLVSDSPQYIVRVCYNNS